MTSTNCSKNPYWHRCLRLTGIHFTILLFFLSGFILNAQKNDTREVRSSFTIDAENPIVYVSDTLYGKIVNWLKTSNDISLGEYLSGNKVQESEIYELMNLLGIEPGSDKNKNKRNKMKALDCQCNAIMPFGDFTKKTSDAPLDTFKQDHKGVLGGKFWHKWITYNNDGLGFSIDVKVESNFPDGKSWDVTLSQEGSSTLRITNICTDGLGYRNDLCNCDKDILYNGGYANKILTATDFATNKNSGTKLALSNGYYVYSSEENVPGNGTASFDTIDSGVWGFSLKQGTTINFPALGTALTHLASFAFSEDTNLAGRFGHLGSFISTLDTIRHIDDTTSMFNYSHVRDFTGALKLRANVPRNFRAFATIKTLNETVGRKKNLSETSFRSIFNWNFYIPSSKASYTFAGVQNPNPSEGCCSESVGLWEFHGSTFDSDMNFVGQQFKNSAENFLNYDLMGQAVNWSQSRYSSDPSLLSGGFVNLEANDATQFPVGHLYTVDRCNCESFITYDTNSNNGTVSPNFLVPDLTVPTTVLCPDETFEIFINNANELSDPCQVVEIRLNNQLIFSGHTSNFNIAATGNYEVSFYDECTGCRVSTSFSITRCSTGDDDADCIRDHFSIFPNPVLINNPELMFEACLGSCADTTSINDVNTWASDYFPASITIRDINTGSIFYGPTTHFSPVSVDADFCLHDQIPSATVGSWTSRINTNAVLTVQLLNGDSFSKIIQLR